MQECGLDGMHPGRSTLQQAATLLQRAFEVPSTSAAEPLHRALKLLHHDPCAKLSRPVDNQQSMAPS